MAKITFIDPAKGRCDVEVPTGISIMEAGREAGFDLEGRCEGSLACSTCHVVVAPEWFDRVGEPSLDEQDMLDLVTTGLSPTSRLCCQIIATPSLDGLVVMIPVKRSA